MTEDRVPTHEREECGYCGRTYDEGHGPDCPDRRAMTEDRVPTHPWEDHDDSCVCHISICMECGCTNEYERSAQPAPPLDVAAEIAYEMKVFLHGAKSAPPVAPGWLAQIEKWRERLAER